MPTMKINTRAAGFYSGPTSVTLKIKKRSAVDAKENSLEEGQVLHQRKSLKPSASVKSVAGASPSSAAAANNMKAMSKDDMFKPKPLESGSGLASFGKFESSNEKESFASNIKAFEESFARSGFNKTVNAKAELFGKVPTGTELQLMERRQEAKLYQNVHSMIQKDKEKDEALAAVLQMVQEQGETMQAMREEIEGLKEDKVGMQEQLDDQEKRIHELENPRRSKRIMALGRKKKKNKQTK